MTVEAPATATGLAPAAGGSGRRAVVLVGGPAAPYSRSIRVARALAAEGYAVEIAAIAADGVPDRESVAGPAATQNATRFGV